VCFDIALDLENPNTEELELLEFRYGVSVAGGEVYRGKRSAEATLAPQRVFRLWIPAVVRYDRVTFDASTHPRTLSWSVGGSLSYITHGEIAEILLDTGVRKPRQSFGGTGEVSLPPGG